MKFIVLNNITHPLGTELQYLKTIKEHFEKLPSPYDSIPSFTYSNLCTKDVCECQLYHKRKHLIVIDPVCCARCRYTYRGLTWNHSSCHQVLLSMMLNISLCLKCETNNDYCQDCIRELKRKKELWTTPDLCKKFMFFLCKKGEKFEFFSHPTNVE